MKKSTSGPRRLGRWLVPVIAVCVGAAAVMTIQACRFLCPERCMPPAPVISFYLKTCIDPSKGDGVWFLPEAVQRVQKRCPLQLVNTTPYILTVSAANVFDEGSSIQLQPLQVRTVKVSRNAPMGPRTLDVAVQAPGRLWSDSSCGRFLPGPGVDVEKPH
jgi:hypothetical protein